MNVAFCGHADRNRNQLADGGKIVFFLVLAKACEPPASNINALYDWRRRFPVKRIGTAGSRDGAGVLVDWWHLLGAGLAPVAEGERDDLISVAFITRLSLPTTVLSPCPSFDRLLHPVAGLHPLPDI